MLFFFKLKRTKTFSQIIYASDQGAQKKFNIIRHAKLKTKLPLEGLKCKRLMTPNVGENWQSHTFLAVVLTDATM